MPFLLILVSNQPQGASPVWISPNLFSAFQHKWRRAEITNPGAKQAPGFVFNLSSGCDNDQSDAAEAYLSASTIGKPNHFGQTKNALLLMPNKRPTLLSSHPFSSLGLRTLQDCPDQFVT